MNAVHRDIESRQRAIHRTVLENPHVSEECLLLLNQPHFSALEKLYLEGIPAARIQDAMAAAIRHADSARPGLSHRVSCWMLRFLADSELRRRLALADGFLVSQHLLIGRADCSIRDRFLFLESVRRRQALAAELSRRASDKSRNGCH